MSGLVFFPVFEIQRLVVLEPLLLVPQGLVGLYDLLGLRFIARGQIVRVVLLHQFCVAFFDLLRTRIVRNLEDLVEVSLLGKAKGRTRSNKPQA